jgi:hypothetical protein
MNLDVDDIRALLPMATRNGTELAWCTIALEWMEQATTHISNLQRKLDGYENTKDTEIPN